MQVCREFLLRSQLYVNWVDFARYGVGLMRGLYASRRDDSAFCGMIDHLCSLSPEFDRLRKETAQQGTSSYAPNRVHLRISEFGDLNFLLVRLTVLTTGD